MDRASFIRAETEIAAPPLCPELRLHLVTERCRLWRATEADLEALSLPPPFWAFCWPGGQALARYLLDHPDECRGRRVLDFGAGGAVEGLAALKAGASKVIANDIDPFAAVAAELNAGLNGVALTTDTRDLLGTPQPGLDLLLAGDVCYDRDIAGRVERWIVELAAAGTRVLLADPGRGFLEGSKLVPIAEYDAPADVDVGGVMTKRTRVFEVRP